MVTNTPYEEVPDFVATANTEWPAACETWLAERGMGVIVFKHSPPGYIPSWVPIILQGRTGYSSHLHFVVQMEGVIIDPHESQSGLSKILYCYAVVTKPLAKHIAALERKA